MKMVYNVKTEGKSLEPALEKRLRDLLASVPGLTFEVERNFADFDRAFDIRGTIDLRRTGDRVELWVECKDLPRPSQFPHVNLESRVREGGSRETIVPVLAAPFISPRMAQLCDEHGWGWFDLAGNCRFVVPGALYIERRGFPPVHKRPKPKANLGTPAAARVLRALLAPDNAGMSWTQTNLQKHCQPGVSIGLINKVVTHLRDEAWLEWRADGRFRVHDPLGLLKVWGRAYRFDRHRRVNYFTLLKGVELKERLAQLECVMGEAAYAAFSAAEIQAPSVRQSKTWLFVNDRALDDFERIVQAKPVDSGENLVVLVPEDDGVFFLADAGHGNRLSCTNPVQTWLDLLHAGGRGEEAAEALLNQCLKPAWKGVQSDV